MPWLMIVLSRATTGAPRCRAADTSALTRRKPCWWPCAFVGTVTTGSCLGSPVQAGNSRGLLASSLPSLPVIAQRRAAHLDICRTATVQWSSDVCCKGANALPPGRVFVVSVGAGLRGADSTDGHATARQTYRLTK